MRLVLSKQRLRRRIWSGFFHFQNCPHSLAPGCITTISVAIVTLPPTLLQSNLPLALSFKDTFYCIWIIKDNLPISRYLITSLLWERVTGSRDQDVDVFGAIIQSSMEMLGLFLMNRLANAVRLSLNLQTSKTLTLFVTISHQQD